MNKKLLLITLLYSASISAFTPDLPNADTDGCADSEDTVHAFLQELRNANKQQNVPPVATPKEQPKAIITKPVYRNKEQTQALQQKLQAAKERLEVLLLERDKQGFTLAQLILQEQSLGCADEIQSPNTRALLAAGTGGLTTIIATIIVDEKFGDDNNATKAAFGLGAAATLVIATKFYLAAKKNNETYQTREKISTNINTENVELENCNKNIKELKAEIAELEARLGQQA